MFPHNSLHCMLDLETDGLLPCANSIIELGVVTFKFEHRHTVSGRHFHALLQPAPLRRASQSTLKWMENHPARMELYRAARTTGGEPFHVLIQFGQFIETLRADHKGDAPELPAVYLWAKHSEFDIAFLNSYYAQYGLTSPFNYRNMVDMPSFVHGLGCAIGCMDLYGEVRTSSDQVAHRALVDCDTQIAELNRALAYLPE